MAAQISQKEYLRKYLSGGSSDKKKKKKKPKTIGKSMKIIDDDLDISKMRPINETELDVLCDPEDAPQVVGIIDDTPEELKYKTDKWKVISQDDGFDSKTTVQQISKKKKVTGSSKDDSDLSPPRGNDSDLSPERPSKTKQNVSSRRRNGSDSDLSPDRNVVKERRNSDSDLSPPRERKTTDKNPSRGKNGRGSDSDLSPPRRRKSPERNHRRKDEKRRNHSSDSDLSPRRNRKNSPKRSRWDRDDRSRRQNDHHERRSDAQRSPDRKTDKTLDGKKAGLQNADQLKAETDIMRRKEDEMFSKMSDEYTGKNAQTVKRDMRLGKSKKDLEAEKKEQEEREAKQKELEAKYSRWGKGLKQTEEHEERVKQFVHESSKPLARYRDDQDLEEALRNRERAEDPMLEYMRKKNRVGDDGVEVESRPMYKGAYPANRFNIRPGHRWDGVDRSNGYEKNYFKVQSEKVAREEESYKWSTEDM